MNKQINAKLNHLLKGLAISKEQKDAIIDIIKDNSSGGGIEKFNFTVDITNSKLNINGKYKVDFPNMEEVSYATIEVSSEIFNYLFEHVNDYIIFTIPDTLTIQLYSSFVMSEAIDYAYIVTDDAYVSFKLYIRFIEKNT